MQKQIAGEIMVPLDRYPHIPYWFTIRQAIAEMETAEIDINGRRSIPRVVLVFDEAYRLMGFVRRRDILRGLLPNVLTRDNIPLDESLTGYSAPTESDVYATFSDQENEQVREQANRPVSSIMNPIVLTVDYNDQLLKVVRDIVVKNYYMLPVTRDGKVVGVIRSIDVLHQIAAIVL